MPIASILIVEDEAIIALGIQEELELLGYKVAGAAYKGEDALRLAESDPPDLILMDINLRGKLDGIETAKQLRVRHRIPIVFLTGAVDNESIQRAKAVEPYGYILKPFSMNDLHITIEHALNKSQLEFKARQSEARFLELFETSLDGILITDFDGNILDSNPAFCNFLGYIEEDLRKMKISQLTPQEYRKDEAQVMEDQVLVRGYSNEIFREYLHQNGARIPASVRIWLRKDAAGKPVGFWTIIRDITPEKIAEQKIIRQAEFSQKLVKLTALLNAQLELPKVLEIICYEITQALNVETAEVTFTDPKKDTLAIAHTYGPIDAREIIQTPYPKEIYNRFFAHGDSYVIIQDVQEVLSQHPYYGFLVKNNIRTAVIVNLKREDQLIGTLDLATIGKTRIFDAEELTFLKAFANHAAIAIDRARLYQQTKRRAEELEVLGRLSSQLRLAVSRQEMLPILLKESIGLTSADASKIYLLGQAGYPIDNLQYPEANDQQVDWFTPSGALWAKALSSDELVMDLIPEVPIGEIDQSTPPESPIQLRILVPFHSTNTLAAILVLGFVNPNILTKENRQVLLSLAEMGGNALHRSGLMEMLEQRVSDRTRELTTLYDLTVFVNSPLGLDKILDEALRKVVSTIQASCGIIYRYEPGSSRLHLETQVNMPVHMLRIVDTLNISRELIQWLESSLRPWLAFKRDGQSLPIKLPGADLFEVVINVPIRFEGKTLGLLTVLWLDEYNPTAEGIAFLSAVAERLGSYIQNDFLRQKSEQAAVLEERQRLARELHDSVTQSLYSLTLLAEAGQDLLAQKDLDRLRKCLSDLAENSVQALKEMRMLLFELRPPQTQSELGLVQALQNRLEAVEQRAGVKAKLEVEEGLFLQPGIQEELYRIAIEALNNSLKHSGANTVLVKLQSADDSGSQMIIEDYGKGFDPQIKNMGGMGLNTMRERVERLGGVMEICSAPGQGTRVTIKINPSRQ